MQGYSFEFIRNLKLFSQRIGMKRMEKSNNTICKLVTFYQNTVIISLQKGFLKWRNNITTIQNRKIFLKRVLRRTNINNLYHAWNTWKLEAKARSIQIYHQN